jgi:hypothetical protein
MGATKKGLIDSLCALNKTASSSEKSRRRCSSCRVCNRGRAQNSHDQPHPVLGKLVSAIERRYLSIEMVEAPHETQGNGL